MIAAVSWAYFQPALERCVTFDLGWIGEIYARNMVIMLVVAGVLEGIGRQVVTEFWARLAIGFAYGAQEAETLPLDPFDQPLDLIVTETEMISPI